MLSGKELFEQEWLINSETAKDESDVESPNSNVQNLPLTHVLAATRSMAKPAKDLKTERKQNGVSGKRTVVGDVGVGSACNHEDRRTICVTDEGASTSTT